MTAARPDPTRGQSLFQKHCAICHRLGGQGAEVGPPLDGIGLRGLDRLLEDLLTPSRQVAQAYRRSTLLTVEGRVLTGLVLREDDEAVVLVDAEGKEKRVPARDIDSRRLTTLSPMPANLAETISESDFYDLLAFLLNQRVPAVSRGSGGRE
jgi:putative heme-binding domain-containing protein